MWIWPLGIALISLLVAAAAFMEIKRRSRETQDNEQRLNQRIEVLEQEVSAMMDGAFGVASQLQKVESNLKSTVQQQEQIQQRDMGNLPYNEAVRRVSAGADVDELVEHCGLSRAEAELVEMLHKKSSSIEAQTQPIETQKAVDESPAVTDHQNITPQSGAFESPSFDPAGKEPFVPERADDRVQNTPDDDFLTPDLAQFDDDLETDEPLFSGDLAGDAFQLALERAREFQAQSINEPEDEPPFNSESAPPSKSHE